MDIQKRNAQIANSYYNLGLEKAKMRDLSGAAQSLKDSLHFNKYQTDARNLLGLIYYESGEVSDALVQWVISLNLQPEKNLADHYLDEIQRKPGQLEIESQNIKTFNQALWHAQNGSDDLAIMQLARVVQAKPHFVKAHLLLALLYMGREDYTKAGRSLYKILQIDKSNPKALYYMSIVKQNTGRAEAERKRMAKAFSHRQMQDDDVIMPPTYKENTGLSTVLHIVIGLVIGVAAFFFLVLPANEKALNEKHNQEMIPYLQKLNNASQQYETLKNQYDELDESAAKVQAQLDELVNGNTSYAAELFATSIREFEKGRVVGTRTAGKGTIQCRPVALSDGSAFSYTVGLLLSKNGATFNGTGISPDVEASLSAEEEANFYNFTVDTDPQILRAFEVVDTLTGRNDIQASLEPSQSSSASEAGGAGSSLQSEPAGTDASSAAEPAA